MEPIISPWLVYLISVVDNFRTVCTYSFVFSLMALVIYLIGLLFTINYEDDFKYWISWWKPVKYKVFILSCICSLFILFIPTRNVLIAMVVADKATNDSVNSLIQSGKDIKNTIKQDIIDLLMVGKEKQEEK